MSAGLTAVFVGGCPRSGTTMLGSMLGADPGAVCTPVSHFKTDVFTLLGSAEPELDLRRAFSLMQEQETFADWNLDVSPADVPFDSFGTSYRALLEWLVRRYGERHDRPEATTWIDHSPNNIRCAGLLQRIFPDARWVHILRDGRGAAASVLPLDWGPNGIEEAGHWWTEFVAWGLACEDFVGEKHAIRVRYEDLLGEPVTALQRLADFLGLAYSEGMTTGKGVVLPEFTKEQHALIGSAPDPKRGEAWRESLSDRQIEVFEWVTSDLLAYLGYPLCFEGIARGPRLRERLRARWLGPAETLINRRFRYPSRRRRAGA